MHIFKLFYTSKKIPSFNINYFTGQSNQTFGIEIEPEKYREFMNDYYHLFTINKVQQHIMTNFKFLALMKEKENLGVEVLNIILKERDALESSEDENYICFIDAINKTNIKLAFKYLEILIKDGINISKLECIIKDCNDHNERLNIYNNGTISFAPSLDKMKEYFKCSHVIDYLVKGNIMQ